MSRPNLLFSNPHYCYRVVFDHVQIALSELGKFENDQRQVHAPLFDNSDADVVVSNATPHRVKRAAEQCQCAAIKTSGSPALISDAQNDGLSACRAALGYLPRNMRLSSTGCADSAILGDNDHWCLVRAKSRLKVCKTKSRSGH
jgi:hypothetical protein